MKAFARLLSLATITLGLVASRPAAACYNETEIKIDPRAIDVAAADHLLVNEQPVAAAQKVLSRFPGLRGVTIEPTARDPLVARAARILAVAIVRTEGRTSFAERTAWAPAGNLAWAVTTLREVTVWKERLEMQRAFAAKGTKSESPDLAADLAEALSLEPRTRGEGKKLLESLDRRDLLGSAHAYRALARLRAEDGESAGSVAALERCKVRSTHLAVCTKPLPPARL